MFWLFDCVPVPAFLGYFINYLDIFSPDELAEYSNCLPSKAVGNIINEDTVWDITGKYCINEAEYGFSSNLAILEIYENLLVENL